MRKVASAPPFGFGFARETRFQNFGTATDSSLGHCSHARRHFLYQSCRCRTYRRRWHSRHRRGRPHLPLQGIRRYPRALSFKDVEGSMEFLETLSRRDMSAKCALNLALLDGAGKRANKPIYDLLELGFRENHHSTSFTIGIDKPDIIRKKVLEAGPY